MTRIRVLMNGAALAAASALAATSAMEGPATSALLFAVAAACFLLSLVGRAGEGR